jgi:hypothetical protein
MESEKIKNSGSMKSDSIDPVHAAPDLAERASTLKPRISLAQRALLLLACCGLGLVIGFIGQSLTSQSAWYLAVSICIAVAWLFVADPNECVACDVQRPRDHIPRG